MKIVRDDFLSNDYVWMQLGIARDYRHAAKAISHCRSVKQAKQFLRVLMRDHATRAVKCLKKAKAT